MDKGVFDALFEEVVAEPLCYSGFARMGKTLYVIENSTQVSLIRLGGRNSRPGAIVHILCRRHMFLRDIKDERPNRKTFEVFDYPYKFRPSELIVHDKPNWRYEPQNSNYDKEVYKFSSTEPATVRCDLLQLAAFILNEFVPWALAIEPATCARQIAESGENVWCEKLWLEDYESYLAH